MATQEIGLPIDLSKGVFNNTVFLNGKLQLSEIAKSEDGTSIYPPEGYWISESIRIADKVAQFKYIAKNIIGSGNFQIYTQSSQDGFVWTEWKLVNGADGAITTPVGYYARVKIFIFSVNTNVVFTIDQFASTDKYINQYVNSSQGVLELKTDYTTPLMINTTLTDGVLMKSSPVSKTNFKKINNLRIE